MQSDWCTACNNSAMPACYSARKLPETDRPSTYVEGFVRPNTAAIQQAQQAAVRHSFALAHTPDEEKLGVDRSSTILDLLMQSTSCMSAAIPACYAGCYTMLCTCHHMIALCVLWSLHFRVSIIRCLMIACNTL